MVNSIIPKTALLSFYLKDGNEMKQKLKESMCNFILIGFPLLKLKLQITEMRLGLQLVFIFDMDKSILNTSLANTKY